MSVRRVAVLLMMVSLACVIGCGRSKPKPKTSPPGISKAEQSAQFVVGKWQAKDRSDKPLDWAFFDADLTTGPPVVRFTPEGRFIAYMVEGAEYGTTGPYKFVDGKLEVTGPIVDDGPKPKSRQFTVTVDSDTLVISDDEGNSQSFARAQPVAAAVKIAQLPLCCKGCGIVLEEQLEKLPGVSAIKVDLEKRTATLALKDSEDINKVRDALHQAGMDGQLSLDGRVLQTGGVAYGGKPPSKIVLTDVHACCAECEDKLAKLVKGNDVKVAFTGDGPRKTMTITGANLDLNLVMTKLGNAGYYFNVDSP